MHYGFLITVVGLLICISTNQSFAQISIGDNRKAKSGKLHQHRLEALSNSTTLFVLREKDNPARFKTLLDSCWTFGPYQVISFPQLDNFLYCPGYSFYTHTGHAMPLSPGSYQDYFYSLLWMPNPEQLKRRLEKKESLQSQDIWLFARSDLYPQGAISVHNYPLYYMQQDTGLFDRRILDFANSAHPIYNAHPGFLKNQLQLIQRHLVQSEPRALYEPGHHAQISNLRQQTLFVPDHLLLSYIHNKDQNVYQAQLTPAAKLFANYPYPYKVLSTNQLGEKILQDKTSFLYLNYLRIGNHSILNIIDAHTGAILYTDIFKGGPIKGNLTAKRLEKLAKVIAKDKI